MNKKEIQEFLTKFPGYLNKVGISRLAKRCNAPISVCKEAIREFKTEPKKEFKRLFWDIETSYNVVSTWNVGYNLTISHDNIIKERAIICICYKWQGEDAVHYLRWDKGCDKQLLIDFVKILNQANESIGHNSDRFDEKWVRTRCLYHNIPMLPQYQTLDTLKLAKKGFRFNSNRLDYLGKFLGFGGKTETGGFDLWRKIVEENDEDAMDKMIEYCKNDVILLENIYDRINSYTKSKTHVGAVLGKPKTGCPNCGSEEFKSYGFRYTVAGNKKQVKICSVCDKAYNLPVV